MRPTEYRYDCDILRRLQVFYGLYRHLQSTKSPEIDPKRVQFVEILPNRGIFSLESVAFGCLLLLRPWNQGVCTVTILV